MGGIQQDIFQYALKLHSLRLLQINVILFTHETAIVERSIINSIKFSSFCKYIINYRTKFVS